ncbi:hypothetical protein BT63DRAFT_477151 [Microthyrium microscopicum]|uniref:Uncharacterized protein n=1 Tax=Microthyrium microscopicum TaxID=703497 RepID=A0A6A6UN94_9PEZI|nr:hypothetical protein BT63DRAFT_477151 [Microthyrium microscopicum]
MKTKFAITVLAVSSQITSASIIKRDFSQADVQNFVNTWNTDVQNVNNFLDDVFIGGLTTANPGALADAARNALTFASDEPVELMRLGSLPNLSGQGMDAAMNLMMVFGSQVIDNLNNIISNPTDSTIVNNAVTGINNVRCFNVLPDLCNLWPASFSAVGLDPATAPAPLFEKACTQIFAAAGVTPQCEGKAPVVA